MFHQARSEPRQNGATTSHKIPSSIARGILKRIGHLGDFPPGHKANMVLGQVTNPGCGESCGLTRGPSSIHCTASLLPGHTIWQCMHPTRQLCQSRSSHSGKGTALSFSLWKVGKSSPTRNACSREGSRATCCWCQCLNGKGSRLRWSRCPLAGRGAGHRPAQLY